MTPQGEKEYPFHPNVKVPQHIVIVMTHTTITSKALSLFQPVMALTSRVFPQNAHTSALSLACVALRKSVKMNSLGIGSVAYFSLLWSVTVATLCLKATDEEI